MNRIGTFAILALAATAGCSRANVVHESSPKVSRERAIFAEVRDAAVAIPPNVELRVTDRGPDISRIVYGIPHRVELDARALTFSDDQLRVLFAHEFGHLILAHEVNFSKDSLWGCNLEKEANLYGAMLLARSSIISPREYEVISQSIATTAACDGLELVRTRAVLLERIPLSIAMLETAVRSADIQTVNRLLHGINEGLLPVMDPVLINLEAWTLLLTLDETTAARAGILDRSLPANRSHLLSRAYLVPRPLPKTRSTPALPAELEQAMLLLDKILAVDPNWLPAQVNKVFALDLANHVMDVEVEVERGESLVRNLRARLGGFSAFDKAAAMNAIGVWAAGGGDYAGALEMFARIVQEPGWDCKTGPPLALSACWNAWLTAPLVVREGEMNKFNTDDLRKTFSERALRGDEVAARFCRLMEPKPEQPCGIGLTAGAQEATSDSVYQDLFASGFTTEAEIVRTIKCVSSPLSKVDMPSGRVLWVLCGDTGISMVALVAPPVRQQRMPIERRAPVSGLLPEPKVAPWQNFSLPARLNEEDNKCRYGVYQGCIRVGPFEILWRDDFFGRSIGIQFY